jgi:predicted negative regulator of RcsB-dependent stress response
MSAGWPRVLRPAVPIAATRPGANLIEPRHLDDALEAVDGALEEFRKAKADFYIEKAEQIRGDILAAKGKL